MDQKYTKYSPKVLDYNPLTHTPFYNKSPNLSNRYFQEPLETNIIPKNRASYLNRSSLFSSGQTHLSSSVPVSDYPTEPSPIRKNPSPYFRLTFRNKIIDPISGQIRIYGKKPHLESFYHSPPPQSHKKSIQKTFIKQRTRFDSNVLPSITKDIQLIPIVDPFFVNHYAK